MKVRTIVEDERGRRTCEKSEKTCEIIEMHEIRKHVRNAHFVKWPGTSTSRIRLIR